jgi:hypothetical protein
MRLRAPKRIKAQVFLGREYLVLNYEFLSSYPILSLHIIFDWKDPSYQESASDHSVLQLCGSSPLDFLASPRKSHQQILIFGDYTILNHTVELSVGLYSAP